MEEKSCNFMQRVGASSCIRCDFKTDESQSFAEQDAEMMAHLTEVHPNWMFDKAHAPVQKSPEQKLLVAAYDALRSYQYGNGSTELAEEIANSIGLYFSGGKE